MTLISFSKNHIDYLVKFDEGGPEVRVTGIYGADARNRGTSWNLIRSLHEQHSAPWLIGGDFNEILHNPEKRGGSLRSSTQIEDFGGALADCGLMDLGYTGNPLTWSNNRSDPHTVYCRLDRVCINGMGHTLFLTATVHHIDYVGSDHIPILLQLVRPATNVPSRRQRPFRFEAVWVRKDECLDIVRHVWETSHDPDSVAGVIYNGEECKASLLSWRRATDPDKEIRKIRATMINLKKSGLTVESKAEYERLSGELEKLYYDQAMYSRIWMRSYCHLRLDFQLRTRRLFSNLSLLKRYLMLFLSCPPLNLLARMVIRLSFIKNIGGSLGPMLLLVFSVCSIIKRFLRALIELSLF